MTIDRNTLRMNPRRLIKIAMLAMTLAAACAWAQGPCPRFAEGSQIVEPEDLYSQNGALTVSFTYQTYTDSNNLVRYCFVNSDGSQSPTLHVKPGDTLTLTVTNDVPPSGNSMPAMQMTSSLTNSPATTTCGDTTMTDSSVNVHFHGMNILPVCHQDEVIQTLINSGSTFVYTVQIPTLQPPGLFWYHPHVHGIADPSVLGGASGAIIVDGIENLNPIVDGLATQLLIIRDNLLPSGSKTQKPVPSRDVSLNYIPIPYPTYPPAVITMPANAQQFWRVVNASADTMINLQVIYDGQPQTLTVVELDGAPIGTANGGQASTITENEILLPPAARAEFIVTGPSSTVTTAQLVTQAVDTGNGGFINPQRTLAMIQTSSSSTAANSVIPKVSGKATALPFNDLAQVPSTIQRELHFSEDEQGFYITVNGHIPRVYNPDLPPAITTTQGNVEDWTIQNHALEAHEFHIHQIHFLLMERNGQAVPPDEQQMMDTIFIPGWSGKGGYPSVTVRLDFRGPDVGSFVYHCHILKHEDGGMMQIIRVLPKNPSQDAKQTSPAQTTSPAHTDTANADVTKRESNEPSAEDHSAAAMAHMHLMH
jgi:FtsP/CotA-like multicopper oxidase with cupredoxin domain